MIRLYPFYSLLTESLKGILKVVDKMGFRAISNLNQRTEYVVSLEKNKKKFWFHAASVGEVRGIYPLLKLVVEEVGSNNIIFTTTSVTGQAELERLAPEVFRALAPYDSPSSLKNFIKVYEPEVLIINETEIWPSMLTESKHSNIKIVLVNARISDKAYPSYLRWKFFFKEYLGHISSVFSQTELDKDRFISLGVESSRIVNIGSTKYDFPIGELASSFTKWWSELEISRDKKVIVFGSIREEEEEEIILCIKFLIEEITNKKLNILLIISPRHPKRFDPFCLKLEKLGIGFLRRSEVGRNITDINVVVFDVMGELLSLYKQSNLCFVGGTFSKIGGHNILEPAYFSKPIITGPNTQNMRDVSQELALSGGMVQVENGMELGEKILEFLRDDEVLVSMGKKSGEVCSGLKGVSEVIFKRLKEDKFFY